MRKAEVCPSCASPVESVPASYGMTGYSCASCGWKGLLYQLRKQERNRQAKQTSLPPEKESELVRATVEGLQYAGYIVLRVGQWRADYAGTDEGTPDLFVWCPVRQGWIGLEVKTQSGKVRKAQRQLAEAGMTHIVRSVEDAFEAVKMRTGGDKQ